MKKIYVDEEQCCGCSACSSICPQKIIELKTNKEGFLYPQITDEDKCIHCNLCKKVCPMTDTVHYREALKYYVAVAKNDNIWNQSSSGGIMNIIGSYVINNLKGVVFGARWEGLKVVFDYAKNQNDLLAFCKSKYISANPMCAYLQVKSFLEEGRYVLFTGCPCQINGLKKYLQKNYEKLICIDFACHGQGSPEIFKRWIDYLQNHLKKKIIHFEFREKKDLVDHYNSNCCSYMLEDGKRIITTRDYYHHAYVNGLCMRKSCENCKFAANRASDITVADYKHQIELIPYKVEKRNMSTVVIQSEKGNRFFDFIKNDLLLYHADRSFIEQYNPKLVKSIDANKYRDWFMHNVIIDNKNILKTIKKEACILPSERLEYNVSNKLYSLLYPISRLLDYVYLIFRKLRRITRKVEL